MSYDDIRDQVHAHLRHSRIQERYDLVEKIAIQLLPSLVPPADERAVVISYTMDYARYLANALEAYKEELELR